MSQIAILPYLDVAEDLELAGLIWRPEIGDEISARIRRDNISILVDPQGMSPDELRSTYLWLPSVEQLIVQFEARQAILFHAGLELTNSSLCYKTIIQAHQAQIEAKAESLRLSMGIALRQLLLSANEESVN